MSAVEIVIATSGVCFVSQLVAAGLMMAWILRPY